MKFLVVLCLLAVAAADEDKSQDKKTQPFDTTQNTSALSQPATSLLNSAVFPPTAFSNVFSTADPALQAAYSAYNGNVSPIQTVNPDFFTAAAAPVVNAPIPAFPVTRAVLPPTSGIQNAFPVTGNVFPTVAQVPSAAVPSQFPAVGILSPVNAVQGVTNAVPNAAPAGTVIQTVPATAYRYLTPEGIPALPAQGLQPAQQVGLAAIPAFTSGILPSLGNNVLQGQNIPAGLQQIIAPPTGTAAGIPTTTGPLNSVFRQA